MRILVVEDDPLIANFLKTNLEKSFFAVDVALDGEKGIFLGRSNDYDLIILDNILPKKNGREVCQEIREKKKGVKIIMLSALADVSTKVDLLETGADDYMSKPFSFSELLARIKVLLRRPNEMNEEIITLGDLIIDLKNGKLKKGEKSIHLTRKEFMLLEFLAKNAGRTLTQLAIMEHVWGLEVNFFSHTLKSHIRNLRAKIDKEGEKSLIQTVSGRGYRIEAK